MKDPKRTKRKEPSRLGDILAPLLKEKLGTEDLSHEHEIGRFWKSAVGDEIARHATPGNLRKGTLLVNVDQAAWATELQYRSAMIISRLNEKAGKNLVRDLRFRVVSNR